jgi:hypothetical protein
MSRKGSIASFGAQGGRQGGDCKLWKPVESTMEIISNSLFFLVVFGKALELFWAKVSI